MRTVNRLVNFLLFVTSTVLFCCAQQASTQSSKIHLARLPLTWPDNQSAAAKVTKKQVVDLFNAMKAAEQDTLTSALSYDVDQFLFAPLTAGRLQLVAVTDDSPRKLFQQISVVSCESTMCDWNSVYSNAPNILSRQVIDLDNDGVDELIVKQFVMPWHTRGVERTFVLDYRGSALTDNSAQYLSYFDATVLPKLSADEAAAVPDELNGPKAVEELRAELQYAKADYRRRILHEKAAGLSDALAWENSADHDKQMLAVGSLEDIEAPEADEALQRITHSKNAAVAEAAEHALIRKHSRAAR